MEDVRVYIALYSHGGILYEMKGGRRFFKRFMPPSAWGGWGMIYRALGVVVSVILSCSFKGPKQWI